jgi:predicted PurR-regulated permease PerM
MSIFTKIKGIFANILPKHVPHDEDIVLSVEKKTIAWKEDQHMHWHVDTMLMVKFRWAGLAIVGVAYVIFQSLSALYLILGAYIISIALESIVLFFSSRGLSRWFSIFLSYMLVVAIFLSGFILLVPFVFSQLSVMIDTLVASVRSWQILLSTQWLDTLIVDINWLPWYTKEYLLDLIAEPQFAAAIQSDLQSNISQLIGLGTSYAQNIGNVAVSLVTVFFSVLAQFTIVVTLAVFFSIEKKMVMRFVAGLWGREDYDFAYAKLDRIYKRLGLWLRGQTIVCLCVGLAVFLALNVLWRLGLSLPSKGSLAIIAGVTNFIPYLWPFLWGVPAVLLAMVHFWWWGVVAVLLVYVVIQQLESSFLMPYVMNRTVGISPLLILISLIVWWLVMGFVGVILAVPIAVIISMMYGKDE